MHWKKYRASSFGIHDNQSNSNNKADQSDSLQLDVYDGSTDHQNSSGKEDENNEVPPDFDITSVYDLDPVATKPQNSKLPHKTLLIAIKWILTNKKMLQRELSEALSVSPSTLSLYMNSIPRAHGWRDLERKLIDWIRNANEDEDAENKDHKEPAEKNDEIDNESSEELSSD